MESDRAGDPYWGDTNELTAVSYTQRDSSVFRLFWKYMPEFRVLDSTDSSRTMAVFTMLIVAFLNVLCNLTLRIRKLRLLDRQCISRYNDLTSIPFETASARIQETPPDTAFLELRNNHFCAELL